MHNNNEYLPSLKKEETWGQIMEVKKLIKLDVVMVRSAAKLHHQAMAGLCVEEIIVTATKKGLCSDIPASVRQ